MASLLPAELPDRFALIIDTSNFEGATQDALEFWQDQILRFHELGLNAICRIRNPADITYDIFLMALDETFQKHFPVLHVGTISEANRVLADLGYEGAYPEEE